MVLARDTWELPECGIEAPGKQLLCLRKQSRLIRFKIQIRQFFHSRAAVSLTVVYAWQCFHATAAATAANDEHSSLISIYSPQCSTSVWLIVADYRVKDKYFCKYKY
jgi:hypothetical protein